MTITTTLVPTILDLVVAGLDGVLSIQVYDGPPIANIEMPAGLFVGATDDDTAIEGEQRWSGLGHATRDDTFVIPCLLYTVSGDNDLSVLRASTKTNLDAIETWLRNNPNAGLTTNTIRAEYGTIYSWRQFQSPDGARVIVRFTINIEGRI